MVSTRKVGGSARDAPSGVMPSSRRITGESIMPGARRSNAWLLARLIAANPPSTRCWAICFDAPNRKRAPIGLLSGRSRASGVSRLPTSRSDFIVSRMSANGWSFGPGIGSNMLSPR